MMEVVKRYGSVQQSPIDELKTTLEIFRNHLKLIDDLMMNFNATNFYVGSPLERLQCLNLAAEYVQNVKDTQTRFMGLTRRMKIAYNIVFPSGELTDSEVNKAQFYLAIISIIYKQTIGDAPDAEVMNQVVEDMVKKAISCNGVEDIIDERLKRIVEKYNTRDKLLFTSEVVDDFVNNLSEELLKILQDLDEDKTSFEELGISYE